MLRGFDYGLLAALGVALVHGIAWSVLELTLGLLAVGVAGGWLIGYSVRQGVASHQARELEVHAAVPQPAVIDPASGADPYASTWQPPPRGMSTVAALLGLVAWIVGSYVAFAIVQLMTGQGDVLSRLTPANFAPFMSALLDPPLLQAAVLSAYVVVAWLSARPSLPRRPSRKP